MGNPVEQRLERLSDQWGKFARNDAARILCWGVQPDEETMIDAFVTVESDERAGQHPDLFLTLRTPFETIDGHAAALQQALRSGYEAGADALREHGLFLLRPESAGPVPGELAGLIATCEAFIADHALPRHLVLVLRPSRVDEQADYVRWLQRFATEAPANVRAIVLTTDGATTLGPLAASMPERVVAQSAALEMPAAFLELCERAGAGSAAGPGSQFRIEFLKLGQALREGVTPRALALAQDALASAAATGAGALVVAVHFTLAGALAGAGQHDAARERYALAESSALQDNATDPAERETARRLRLQARLGSGSTFVSEGQWQKGADYWEQTAELALADGEFAMALDAYRLCAFCHEQQPMLDEAWRTALQGVDVARRLDAAVRATSSFAHLREAITRLASAREQGEDPELTRELEALSQPHAEA